MSKPMPTTRGLSGKATSWLVVVIVAVIVALMFLYSQQQLRTAIEVQLNEDLFKSSAPALQPMEVEQVTEFSLTISGQTIVAESSNGTWRLSEPINDQANVESVQNIIGIFSEMASDEIIENPGALSQYGLEKPYAEATFIDGGVKKSFTIGKEQNSEVFYVKTSANENLYVVRGLQEELTALRPVDLVNAQLLAFNTSDVVKIDAYTSGDDPVERSVEKRNGQWYAVGDDAGVVFEVETLLRDLRYVNVADVLSSGGSGLNPGSTLHLELTLQDGTKKVLEVGDKFTDRRLYYVKSSDRPHTYAVAEFTAENLTDKLASVGTDLMGLDPARARKLSVAHLDPEAAANADPTESTIQRVFELTDGILPWKMGGSVAFAVGEVLDSVVNVNAKSFAPESDDSAYGFYPAPKGVQVVATLDNKATIQLDLGAVTPDGQSRYVKSSAREGIYLTPVGNANAVEAAFAKVRTDMMVFDPETVTGITYYKTDWSGTTSQALAKQGENWTTKGETKTAANVTKFLNALTALTADSMAEEKEEADYGFYPASDAWRVELEFNNGEKLALDVGGTISTGSGWFTITNYFVRVSDLTDVVLIGEFKVQDVQRALEGIL